MSDFGPGLLSLTAIIRRLVSRAIPFSHNNLRLESACIAIGKFDLSKAACYNAC